MDIQFCSDLHLEFPINKIHLRTHPIQPVGDILLLAGDIAPFSVMDKEDAFFDFVADNFEHTYWIPGNHEYYRSDITARSGSFHEHIRSNVTLLNNTTVNHNGVRLVFSTLWTKLDLTLERVIRKGMADFYLITRDGNKINADDYNAMHDLCKAFIAKELATDTMQPTVVVSHHVPTFLHYPEKYKNSELNTAFAVELFDMIESCPADYWIFGHSHEVVPDFTIGKTVLTTNQLGYVEYGEHTRFNPAKLISLTP